MSRYEIISFHVKWAPSKMKYEASYHPLPDLYWVNVISCNWRRGCKSSSLSVPTWSEWKFSTMNRNVLQFDCWKICDYKTGTPAAITLNNAEAIYSKISIIGDFIYLEHKWEKHCKIYMVTSHQNKIYVRKVHMPRS